MKTVVKLLIVCAMFALTLLFNIIQIDLRFEEIRYLLGTIASTDEISNTFGIVARYELIKRRIQFGEKNNENFELEARMQALSSQSILTENEVEKHVKWIRVPVKLALNSIRYLLGKPIISPKEEDRIFSVLEIGYFYERIRKYSEALKYYDELLATGELTPEIRAAILMHKAFCTSMVGKYDQSIMLYEKVISDYPNTEAGILSWKLLEFLNSMETQRATLSTKKTSGVNKAKQFYLLMDFKNAIKHYSVYLGKNRNKNNVAEARFFKGRSHEELGETEEAIMEYRSVIRLDTTKIWARQANRRMLMLGEFYSQQKSIADEARHKLELYQDQIFAKNVDKFTSLVNASSLKGELAGVGNNQKSLLGNDSILNIIDQIGSLEAGENNFDNQTMNQKTIKGIRGERSLSSAEVRELKRRRYLAENPFRRPSVLKQFIDEHSSELRYIYNKRLRSGVKLSGNMLLEIKIRANGTVANAKIVQSNMGDQRFEKTIAARVVQWKFRAVPDSLGELTINYPFEFYEEQ